MQLNLKFFALAVVTLILGAGLCVTWSIGNTVATQHYREVIETREFIAEYYVSDYVWDGGYYVRPMNFNCSWSACSITASKPVDVTLCESLTFNGTDYIPQIGYSIYDSFGNVESLTINYTHRVYIIIHASVDDVVISLHFSYPVSSTIYSDRIPITPWGEIGERTVSLFLSIIVPIAAFIILADLLNRKYND